MIFRDHKFAFELCDLGLVYLRFCLCWFNLSLRCSWLRHGLLNRYLFGYMRQGINHLHCCTTVPSIYNHMNIHYPLFLNLFEVLLVDLSEEPIIKLPLLLLLLSQHVLFLRYLSETLFCQASLLFLLSLLLLFYDVSLFVLVYLYFLKEFSLLGLMFCLGNS